MQLAYLWFKNMKSKLAIGIKIDYHNLTFNTILILLEQQIQATSQKCLFISAGKIGSKNGEKALLKCAQA